MFVRDHKPLLPMNQLLILMSQDARKGSDPNPPPQDGEKKMEIQTNLDSHLCG